MSLVARSPDPGRSGGVVPKLTGQEAQFNKNSYSSWEELTVSLDQASITKGSWQQQVLQVPHWRPLTPANNQRYVFYPGPSRCPGEKSGPAALRTTSSSTNPRGSSSVRPKVLSMSSNRPNGTERNPGPASAKHSQPM